MSISGTVPAVTICAVISALSTVKLHKTSYKQITANPSSISCSNAILYDCKPTVFFQPILETQYHEIIHANDSYQILSFKKTTTQPGLYNELFTNLNDELPYYHNSKISISKEAITIFTLLHLLANGLLDEENYTIEREGLYYDALLLNLPNQSHLQKYKLNLTAIPSAHKIAILEHTDIFTWAVFKQNASRTIWVNATDQKIQKCNFNIGLFNLTAKYLFTDE